MNVSEGSIFIASENKYIESRKLYGDYYRSFPPQIKKKKKRKKTRALFYGHEDKENINNFVFRF